MVNQLEIDNFKCHEHLKLSMKNLTLLVGTNSSGKSSIIQALLLLSHNVSNIKGSPLNGHLVSIGEFSEARNFVTNARKFVISVSSESEKLEFTFEEDDDKEDGKVIQTNSESSELTKQFQYSNGHFHYISAHRIGGQDTYSKNFDRYDTYGINGEFAVDIFQHKKADPLEAILIKEEASQTLESQVNYWLKRIFNIELSTSSIKGTDKIIAEFSQHSNETVRPKKVRPKNTGSGVSYLISILVACLSSKEGDIIIIENPEIHLHPKAQNQLADFFVFISKAKIQLVIETHSDHIFNGLRVQLYKKNVHPEDIAVHFFVMDNETYLSNHTQINFKENGRISNQQELLFDQFDDDINSLLGL